ncbi:MAG: DUF1146 domain-containing protein [Bacilli bacterium]|nr:DUF1146 domain-containing protein [Bacilli bacterium]
MNVKLILYLLFIPLVIWVMLSLKIEHLFKKGSINQIKIFYFIVSLIISYLLVNFIFDIYEVTRIIV